MFIKEYNDLLDIQDDVFDCYSMMDIAYFDIETTGFDREEDSLILISLGRFIDYNNFYIKQYFAESLEDEKDILSEFEADLKKYSMWCSYNGIAFDEPFIKKRMEKHNIFFEAPKHHIDLYRRIRPYYKQLGMERCNLKSVEKHIGIQREDKIDGGISVDLYEEFLVTYEQALKETIMLHNYEDVLNLPKIHEFIYKVENNHNLIREDGITDKQLKYLKSLLKKNELQLNADLERISKKAAARIIDQILKGYRDCEEMTNIINNSY
ncbi:ribonuclease H-like domain-containing protein [Clostridium magnum]|uniref:DNA polymerase family B, exonuclease domain n=1 Tax=Clostridium magnum DSM 2767 TaxID=1121326 RepID=A0A162SFE1_9CLOT|nr:ribonuclease H-like domain-containing protein [Clostridium magnum]KZL91173.1 DNA polymerase family B, exonuclease domain [Clostridium magnum DSM 2767]SHI17636.1 hypothetical protein SAMN02745944_02935 [Clostridium magnum DSM 2767]